MIRILSICAAITLMSLQAQGQLPEQTVKTRSPNMQSLAKQYAGTILPDDIRQHLDVLASDAYEGRETGQKGNRMAARYIAQQFENLGFPYSVDGDSYFQPVDFTWTKWEQAQIKVEAKEFRHLWDFVAFPDISDEMPAGEYELMYLGYGIESDNYNDYAKAKIAGKVLLIYDGEPKNQQGEFIISGGNTPSIWSQDPSKKLALAAEKGAAGVLIIRPDLQMLLSQYRHMLVGPSLSLGKASELPPYQVPHAYISTTLAEALMGGQVGKVIKSRDKVKSGKSPKAVNIKTPWSMTMNKEITSLDGENVLGYLEGSDPVLKEELVVVSAHFDHLGMRNKDVYNGADDNGSGTSTVLDIAEAFMTAKREGNGPKRSILFLLVTGEEKGLLGSKYYVEHPVFPLEQTIANVNVDMIGRTDENHDHSNYVYVIGSDRLSTELHDINEAVNKQYTQLELDYTYNAEDDPNRYYYRSDHYNFAERGIPAIFYFSGVHEDYHRITDTADKIEFEKTAKIGRLIFHTIWELANRPKRIEVNVPQKQ